MFESVLRYLQPPSRIPQQQDLGIGTNELGAVEEVGQRSSVLPGQNVGRDFMSMQPLTGQMGQATGALQGSQQSSQSYSPNLYGRNWYGGRQNQGNPFLGGQQPQPQQGGSSIPQDLGGQQITPGSSGSQEWSDANWKKYLAWKSSQRNPGGMTVSWDWGRYARGEGPTEDYMNWVSRGSPPGSSTSFGG